MVASIGDVLDVNLYNNISKCTCVDKESDLGLDVGETASSDDRDKNLRHVRKSLQHLNRQFLFDPLKSDCYLFGSRR